MRIWDESWRRWQERDRAAALLGAVFLLVSLVIPRALLAGMIYIFA